MADPTGTPPSPEEALGLHQRLLARDPTAPDELVVCYLESLIRWMVERNPAIAEDLIADAVGDALLALIHNPASYQPTLGGLEAYLRMSALGDLRNRLRSEAKHRIGRQSLESVELSEDAGKYLGRVDDPSLPLRIEEERAERAKSIPSSIREGLSEGEIRVLELLLQKERKTAS
jgi:hypothetical protein